mmetsp:Transcript_42194/g.100165  ORF Transcript_42194/g.100165 Transcript_42194/m.100165 type:complete len:235 (-) Transcript_42194:619-1323(-)
MQGGLDALEVVEPGREALADDRELPGGVAPPRRKRHVDRDRGSRRDVVEALGRREGLVVHRDGERLGLGEGVDEVDLVRARHLVGPLRLRGRAVPAQDADVLPPLLREDRELGRAVPDAVRLEDHLDLDLHAVAPRLGRRHLGLHREHAVVRGALVVRRGREVVQEPERLHVLPADGRLELHRALGPRGGRRQPQQVHEVAQLRRRERHQRHLRALLGRRGEHGPEDHLAVGLG